MSTPVYLWEAGRFCGVTGSRDQAIEGAAAVLIAGVTALVEEARLVIAGGSLAPGHERTGLAWTGRLRGGRAVWEPVPAMTR